MPSNLIQGENRENQETHRENQGLTMLDNLICILPPS